VDVDAATSYSNGTATVLGYTNTTCSAASLSNYNQSASYGTGYSLGQFTPSTQLSSNYNTVLTFTIWVWGNSSSMATRVMAASSVTFTVDITPYSTVSWTPPSGSWALPTSTFTITAYPAVASGLYYTYYRIAGANYLVTSGTAFNLAGDGLAAGTAYTLSTWCQSNVANQTITPASTTASYDGAPVAYRCIDHSGNCYQNGGGNSWTAGEPFTVWATSSEVFYAETTSVGSAVSTIHYKLDSASASNLASGSAGATLVSGTTYYISVSVSSFSLADGVYYFHWWGTDAAGNNETDGQSNFITLGIDNTAPVVTLSWTPAYTNGAGVQFASPTTVFTATWTDYIASNVLGCGFSQQLLEVNGGSNLFPSLVHPQTSYSIAFQIGAVNGTIPIIAWGVNELGIHDYNYAWSVYCDANGPVATSTFTANYTTGSGCKFALPGSTQFTVDAAETGSKVAIASVYYEIDGTGWVSISNGGTFTLPSTILNGTHTLLTNAYDGVGITETAATQATNAVTFYVDGYIPTAAISFTPAYTSSAGLEYVSNASFTNSLTVPTTSTHNVPLYKTWYSVNGVPRTYTGTFGIGGSDGIYTIDAWCVDDTGLYSAVATARVAVANRTPFGPATVSLNIISSLDGSVCPFSDLNVYVNKSQISVPQFTNQGLYYGLVICRSDTNATLYSAVENYLATGTALTVSLPVVNTFSVLYEAIGGTGLAPSAANLYINGALQLSASGKAMVASFIPLTSNITVTDLNGYQLWTFYGAIQSPVLTVILPYAFVTFMNWYTTTLTLNLTYDNNKFVVSEPVPGNGQSEQFYLATTSYSYVAYYPNGSIAVSTTVTTVTSQHSTWTYTLGTQPVSITIYTVNLSYVSVANQAPIAFGSVWTWVNKAQVASATIQLSSKSFSLVVTLPATNATLYSTRYVAANYTQNVIAALPVFPAVQFQLYDLGGAGVAFGTVAFYLNHELVPAQVAGASMVPDVSAVSMYDYFGDLIWSGSLSLTTNTTGATDYYAPGIIEAAFYVQLAPVSFFNNYSVPVNLQIERNSMISQSYPVSPQTWFSPPEMYLGTIQYNAYYQDGKLATSNTTTISSISSTWKVPFGFENISVPQNVTQALSTNFTFDLVIGGTVIGIALAVIVPSIYWSNKRKRGRF
jgi:hypothetical protein